MFPFPATMDFTSPYYWNPSTYSWVPNFLPYYPNGAQFPLWNHDPFSSSIPNYSYSIPTTGYYIDPNSYLNQTSYSSYVNYYTPNCIPTNIPGYNPMQFAGTMPMPPPIPSTSAPPAPSVKTETVPVFESMPTIKEELIADIPLRCSNCQTTGSSNWRNVNSKDNIMCHKCFIYRKINKKDRATSKTVMKEVKKEMKRIKSE